MKRQHILTAGALVALMAFSGGAIAAGPGDMGQTVKQATNWRMGAIGMFLVFVVATLFITKWAATQTVRGGVLRRRRRHHGLSERASRSPATTCRRRRSSASRRWCSLTASTA